MKKFLADFKNNYKIYSINIIVSVFFLLPILWILSTSLKSEADITENPTKWIPESLTLENFKAIFNIRDGDFGTYFLNTVVITLITVLIVIIISSLAGYGFSKLDIPLKNLFLLLILSTMMIPFHGLLIPLFNIMKSFNILNTHAALILIYVTFQLPFCVYMLKNTFDAIPESIRESAMIDGSSEIRVFLKIILPLAWPGIATVAIFSAYTTWNDFIIALVFVNSNNLLTLNVGLTNLAVGQYGTKWGLLASGSI